VVCARAVGGGRGQGSPAAGGLPGGRARGFWARPLCGIRARRAAVRCPGMALVDVFDGTGDVDELAGAQRPTAADIDKSRFTKDETIRWLCHLKGNPPRAAAGGCR
jgi:hypothetical protein